MRRKIIMGSVLTVFLFFISLGIYLFNIEEEKINTIEGVVIAVNDTDITLIEESDIIYTFGISQVNGNLGDNIIIQYIGVLDTIGEIQDVEIIDYSLNNSVDNNFDDNGIFRDNYKLASRKLGDLSLDEKIGQLILARYPDENIYEDLKKYHLGGYVLFEDDFKNKTENQVKDMISGVQENSDIPLIIAVDEEGGGVVRVSSNPNLVSEKFKSSRELFSLGGMNKIREDTIKKSSILSKLGINLNLAPVVDVSTNGNDYMYERSLGEDTATTSLYARTVVESSKGLGVSYTLKHFPGYGNNLDTHEGSSIDNRGYEEILENDIPPFEAGIQAGAEAIMVSHNTVSSIDIDNPASISPLVHNILRNDLKFTGVIITDDLAMRATSSIEDVAVKAVLAGNNLIITTDYATSFNSIKESINDGIISEKMIDKLVFRVLAWKYYKGLIIEGK